MDSNQESGKQKMCKDRDSIQERLIDLTLKILYLLTGEDYGPLKKSDDHVTLDKCPRLLKRWSQIMDPPPFLIPVRTRAKKVLEVTQKMMELLMGEVPIRCQDVSVYLSMEEWEYLEGHKDLYKDLIMEEHQPLPSPGSDAEGQPASNHLDQKTVDREEHLPQPDIPSPTGCTEEEIVWREERPLALVSPRPSSHTWPIPSPIKDELLSLEQRDCPSHPDSSTSSHLFPSKMGSLSAGEHLPDSDVSTHQTRPAKSKDKTSRPTHHIKEEPPSGDEGFTDRQSTSPKTKDFRDFGGSLETKRKGFICSLCGKTFRNKAELLAHHRVHTGEKPFQCSDCGKCFSSKSNLVTHRRSHTGERPYGCEECGKRFISSSNLIIHRRIHSGQKPYSCSVCGKTFNNSSYLSRHEKAHSKETAFSCLECGKCFKYGTSFEKHKKSHGEDKPFSCPDCGKRFARGSILAVHQRTHTGERPFSCQICGKGFAARSHLVVHERIHSGEKPYSCPTCQKSFVSSSELRIHQKYHMEEKPYSCPICGKGFVCNSALVRHERVHTRETPFSCSVCGRSYRNRSDFLKHSTTHRDTIVLQ